jgi:hypothetical protein
MWSWSQTVDPIGASLHRATRKFIPHRSWSFKLWADPQLDPLEVSLFRVACSQQVTSVEKLLGARFRPWWRLRPRLQIFLFRNAEEVTQVYGGPAGGFASFTDGRVAVNLEMDWIPLIRHELTHIIGGNWNPHAPAFISEGLAVWAARTTYGRQINDAARESLIHLDLLPIMLGPRPKTYWGTYRYYAYAGSFVSALIERFGLPRFKRFYSDRTLCEANFARLHQQHFQISLADMIEIWIYTLAGPGVARMLSPRFI